MSNKLIIITCLVFCTIGGKAQQCTPDAVSNLKLDNDTLTWESSVNCPTTHYIISIYSGTIFEYVYQADDPLLRLNFLPLCKTYTFIVTAIADHIIGVETQLTAARPLPNDVDIAVNDISGVQIDRDLLLQWHVLPEYFYCVDSFKLLIWKGTEAVPQQVATNQNGYYIIGVAQCEAYEFEVSVIYNGEEHPQSDFDFTVPPKVNTPSLLDVRQDAVTIYTTWSLESYETNKCKVIALFVNSTRFNETIPIADSSLRPDVDVTITGLRASSMYFFTVSVENEAGTSNPFQMAVQTLPIEGNSKLEATKEVEISVEDVKINTGVRLKVQESIC